MSRLLFAWRAAAAALLTLLAGALALPAWAHKPSDSYLSLTATAGSNDIAVRWDIALRDLDYVLQLDRDGDAKLSWGEVRQRSDDITRYATRHRACSHSKNSCCFWNKTNGTRAGSPRSTLRGSNVIAQSCTNSTGCVL